jgi:2'-5' RNA ligase
VRLFIAIPLPLDLATRATRLLPNNLPALRLVKPENLHVTLAFLGETPKERVPDVVTATREAARMVQPFELAFDRAGRFPEGGGRARVVWLGIGEGLGSVERLGARVAGGLRERGLRFEERPLSPHLTIARVVEGASSAEARAIAKATEGLAAPTLGTLVTEIAVMRSVLSPKGATHSPQATIRLG